MRFTLDYGKMICLDAEFLAEKGIKERYDSLAGELRQYVREPAEVQEVCDDDAPSYFVKSRGVEYPIYSPDAPEGEGQSWGRATYALFKIVNDQLTTSEYRFLRNQWRQ
jgi:hypothetical protein